MARYQPLTQFIEEFEHCKNSGHWSPCIDSESTLHDLSYVDYDDVVDRFITAFYMNEYVISDYVEKVRLLQRRVNGNLEALDFEVMSEWDVLAFMTFVIRTDRFCEGTLLEYLRNGTMLACLRRLRDIDNNPLPLVS